MIFDKRMQTCLMVTLLLISSGLPVCAQPAQDFFNASVDAGKTERWKAIHWEPNMNIAKAEAQRQHKPILVVLHNNFGGDTHSTEC